MATPLDARINTRHARNAAAADTHADIIRRLSTTPSLRTNYTDLEQSWEDMTIFAIEAKGKYRDISVEGSVEVTCKTCYIKGRAFAELNIENDLNISQVVDITIDNVRDRVYAFANDTKDQIEVFIDDKFGNVTAIYEKLKNGIDIHDFLPPVMNTSYDLAIEPIPDATLSFRFEDLDLYLEIGTVLSGSATYTVPLYHSQTVAGISTPNGLQIGATFTVELILEVEGALDMTSGLHVKVDDSVSLDVALFGDEVSRIDFNGGQFEFLPVIVQSANATFTATLRVGAQAGIHVDGIDFNFIDDVLHLGDLPDVDIELFDISTADIDDALNYELGGRIQVGIYADVASFKTELKGSTSDDEDCAIEVVQEYSFALAATAGAQVTLGTDTFGPSGGATMNVFTATMASTCVERSPATTTAPTMTTDSLQRRQASEDLPTTEVRTTIEHISALCPSSITSPCAASERVFATSTEVRTAIVTLSGSEDETSDVIFPVPTTIAPKTFGSSANTLPTLTGSPTSYTAEPTTDNFIDRVVENAQDHKRLAIGLGVGIGVGVPVLAGLAVLIFFCVRRRKSVSG